MAQPIKILSVVGARPNFIKIGPFLRALQACTGAFESRLVHTGQHYDARMSASFFDALDIPAPDVDLGVGSGTHAEQVGRTMIAFEPVVRDWRPDWVVVVGDVNATCACAITARKEHVRLAHIEAGIRSFDRDMPEEINRLVTDRLADLHLTPDAVADANLRAEGVGEASIRFVGNIMIDALDLHRGRAAQRDLATLCRAHRVEDQAGVALPALVDDRFAVVTLHRPSNVDDPAVLDRLMRCLVDRVAADMPIVWPVHPRTQARLAAIGWWERLRSHPAFVLLYPVEYLDMLRLTMGARMMLTDSGGLQEECCVLGTPCLTLRWNTERPVTLEEHGGVAVLVGNEPERIAAAYAQWRDRPRHPHRPPLWDGQAAGRIASALLERA